MAKNIKKAEEAAKDIINVVTGIPGKLEKNSPLNPFKVVKIDATKEPIKEPEIVKPKLSKEAQLAMEKRNQSINAGKHAEEYNFSTYKNKDTKGIWNEIDRIIAHNYQDIYAQPHFPITVDKYGQKVITHKNEPVANKTAYRHSIDTKAPVISSDKSDISHTQLQRMLAKDMTIRLYIKLHNRNPDKGQMFFHMYKDWDGPLYDLYKNIRDMPTTPKPKM